MFKRIFLILFLILIASLTHVEAANDSIIDAIGDATSDASASIFSKGMEMFMYKIGDMIYNTPNSNSTSRSATDKKIIELLSFTIDPFAIPEVRIWLDYSMYAYIILGLLVLMISYLLSILDNIIYNPIMDEFIGDGFFHNRLIDTIFVLFAVPIMVLFLVWLVLQINYILSYFISDYIIMLFPLTSNNFILYIFMALASLLLSMLMIIRLIIIVFGTSVAIIIGTLFSIQECRPAIIRYAKSWIKLVFLQPTLLFILLTGLIVINSLPVIFYWLQSTAYLALVCYLCWYGYSAIIGNAMITTAKIIIFKKVIK